MAWYSSERVGEGEDVCLLASGSTRWRGWLRRSRRRYGHEGFFDLDVRSAALKLAMSRLTASLPV